MSMADLVKSVKDHALENYNKDGWDIIVECWTDEELAKELKCVKTLEGAIAKIEKLAKLYNEQRQEVRSMADY